MAILTVQKIAPAGLAPTFTPAAVGGDSFMNPADETTFLYVKNTSAAVVTVTINPFQTTIVVPGAGTLAITPIVVTVPITTGERLIGPFSSYAFGDTAGRVNVTYSAVTSVTVAAIRVVPVTR